MSQRISFAKARGLSAVLDARPIHTDTAGDVTVCILTTQREWIPCLWALVSFYEFSQCRYPLAIYDDGSLSSSSHRAILRLFPNASIIDRRCADLVMPRALAEYPNCLRFRRGHPNAPRIVDLPLLCASPRILMLDDHILFFARPERLVQRLCDLEPGQFVFGRDANDCYACSRDQILEWFGVEVGERVNCGIMLAEISDFKYELLESWLGNSQMNCHSWAEQTLWAMYAGKKRSVFLGQEYDVTACPTIESACVLKRYPEPSRRAVYDEGIARVEGELERRGVFGR